MAGFIQVVKMLIIVVSLFAICWLPLQTYNMLVSFLQGKITTLSYIHIVWLCSNWLAMSNACYNPFIYGLLNVVILILIPYYAVTVFIEYFEDTKGEKFKREFKSLLGCCIFCCKQNRSSYNNINKSQNENSEMTSQRNSIKSNRSDSHFKLVSRKRTDASKGDNQNDYDITHV